MAGADDRTSGDDDPLGPGSDLVLSLFAAMLLVATLGLGVNQLTRKSQRLPEPDPQWQEREAQYRRDLRGLRERLERSHTEIARLSDLLQQSQKAARPAACTDGGPERVGPERRVIEELCGKLSAPGVFQVSCTEEELAAGRISFPNAGFGFESNKYEIAEDHKAAVISLGQHILKTLEPERGRIRNVLLTAHADCEKESDYNLSLSLRRAEAIYALWYQDPELRSYLDPEGAPLALRETGALLVVGGMGEMRPLGLRAPPEKCRKRRGELRDGDRRIEIEITPAREQPEKKSAKPERAHREKKSATHSTGHHKRRKHHQRHH